jgi:tetratricopeptide (TPR) repeat protein
MSVKRVRRIGEETEREPAAETWGQYEQSARYRLKTNPKAAQEQIDQAIRLADSANAFTTCYMTKAEIYCVMTNRINALTYFHRALSRARESPDADSVYDRLFTFYVEGKQFSDAEQFFINELKRKDSSHLQILLGLIYSTQKTYDKAEPYLQAGMTKGERRFQSRAAAQLAKNWLATNQPRKATALLSSRIIAIRHQRDGRCDDDATEVLVLAQALIRTGDLDGATQLLKQEGRLIEKYLGPNHPLSVSLIDAYVTVCQLQGDFAEAEQWQNEIKLRRGGHRVFGSADSDEFANQSFVVGEGLKTVHDLLFQNKMAEATDFADEQARGLETSSDPLLPLFLFQVGLLLQQRADVERKANVPDEEIVKALLIGRRDAAGKRAPNGALHRFVALAVKFPKSTYAKDACLHEDEIISLLNTRYDANLQSSISPALRANVMYGK